MKHLLIMDISNEAPRDISNFTYMNYLEEKEYGRIGNSKRLLSISSVVLLILAFLLFNLGTNNDRVAALAILATIIQLIVTVDAFKAYGH